MEKDGRFRLKSAYNLVVEEEDNAPDRCWKDLWKWKGPNRIKHFMWIVLHGRLLTKKELTRRKITTNSHCNLCPDQEETIDHILRNCSKARVVWDKFQSRTVANSMSLPLQDWLMINLRHHDTATEFGIIIWQLWKQRNEEVMEGKVFSKNGLFARIQAWFNIVRNAQENVQLTSTSNPPAGQVRNVSWDPPLEG
ncbi:unnamed protein product [Linum tenue]|uniref:Reverse transcriptase zinc-binding domain-containing protein n=1 Tax=Linum tenue TaxID=586396 RepID=A0AAV0HFB2_9ROSI|nr:unnamed protein product [Linum tenue]